MNKIKNIKKTALVLAVMATLFNNCEVMAAESDKGTMKSSVRVSDSKDKEKHQTTKVRAKKEMKEVNNRIEVLNKKMDNQQVIQEKILHWLEHLESAKVNEVDYEVEKYNSSALVNPNEGQKINYTQDAANSQDNSMVVFRYAPNQLYKIYCRVGYLTDLSLKKGEIISFVGGGDTSAWAVEKATVDGVPHIYIKPTVETSTTNLIITTNKRSYQLIVNTSDWYNPMVTWHYGQEESEVVNFQERQNVISQIKGNVESLNFNYKITGKSANKPVAIFDDGEKTILKFGKMPKRLPSVFIKNKGKVSMTNYKIRDDCYILDRVAEEIEIRISEKEIIKIKRKK